MADVADIADQQIEHALLEGLRNSRRPTGLIPVGHCHYCEEPIRHGLFCAPVDADGDGCARDWDRERRIEKITGGL